jgi:prenyltransferase beta subunit
MRLLLATILTFAAVPAAAQDPRAAENAETILYVLKLQDRETGGFKVTPDGKPSLRACNGAVKALKYLGAKAVPNRDKVAAFVLSCHDPATGAFAEPGGKPDVAITSIGVMAAAELDIPKEKYAKAMDYLGKNAKTFEEVRIAAAAVEAWGVKDCPFDLEPWIEAARKQLFDEFRQPGPPDNRARVMGSAVAMLVRLGSRFHDPDGAFAKLVNTGQRADGGWGKGGEKGSDLETTYRVMRALHLLKVRPAGAAKVREFVAKCRNADGGYGVKPGDPSSMSGVYYASIVSAWLGE